MNPEQPRPLAALPGDMPVVGAEIPVADRDGAPAGTSLAVDDPEPLEVRPRSAVSRRRCRALRHRSRPGAAACPGSAISRSRLTTLSCAPLISERSSRSSRSLRSPSMRVISRRITHAALVNSQLQLPTPKESLVQRVKDAPNSFWAAFSQLVRTPPLGSWELEVGS